MELFAPLTRKSDPATDSRGSRGERTKPVDVVRTDILSELSTLASDRIPKESSEADDDTQGFVYQMALQYAITKAFDGTQVTRDAGTIVVECLKRILLSLFIHRILHLDLGAVWTQMAHVIHPLHLH